jgi:hypothetical protein
MQGGVREVTGFDQFALLPERAGNHDIALSSSGDCHCIWPSRRSGFGCGPSFLSFPAPAILGSSTWKMRDSQAEPVLNCRSGFA